MRTIEDLVRSLSNRKGSRLEPPLSDTSELERLGRQYGGTFPEDLTCLYRVTSGGFIQMDDNDSWRLLSASDIVEAPSELQVDFVGIRKMPVVDCKDNDFICYDFGRNLYIMMNVADEIVFDEAQSLLEFFSRKLDGTR
jgi:hypothetical protein